MSTLRNLVPIAEIDPVIAQTAFVLILTAVGLVAAVRSGIFRRGLLIGPPRLTDAPTAATWLVIVILGIFVWLGAQVLYASAFTQARDGATTQPATQPADHLSTQPALPPEPPLPAVPDSPAFTTADLAYLSTVPAALAVIVVIAAAATSAPGLLTAIGLDAGRVPKGLLSAGIGLLVSYPLVIWVLIALQQVYETVGYSHPSEHEMLQHLGRSSIPWLRGAIVVGALVLAPLFEELIFRGGLQTLLRRALTGVGRKHTAAAWIAIVVTSILFSLIHEIWMAPGIFFLSLCIGYLYERTGNLWAAIFLHAGFNAAMTVTYLLSV